ncbi:glutaredoxin family protein [Candidatus Poribacteria bacterium]|nr:glutaredoxin family protein [Candidatus Poribacteria bacterium]
MDRIKLQFYTKADCPLCDEAKESLESLAAQVPIQIEEIDITANLGLFTKYKELIPVLELEGKRLFVHRIHVKVLKRKLMWQQWRRWFVDRGWTQKK